MGRRELDYVVIAAMLVSGLYVTGTGVVADLLGLHQFVFHSYAGYACAALVALHLTLNWRRITAYLGRLLTRSPEREGPAERERASHVGRRQVLIAALSAAAGFALGWLIPERRPELPDEATDVGELYHAWSRPGGLPGVGLIPDWGQRPPQYKTYPEAERVALPEPAFQGLSVGEALETRRSVRTYGDEPLSMEDLSRLLHAAQGITEEHLGFRAAPSAGALYPIELYAVVHNVSELAPGIYHHAVREHALERLQRGDFRGAVTRAGLYQGFLGEANACFVLSAIFQRTRWRYHERTYRYVLMEAGHVGQNLYLAATSLGLGACAVGAFFDDALNELVGVDGREEAALYVISVGRA